MPPPAPAVSEPSVHPERGTVLVVDDEPVVQATMARLLKRMGFAVIVASDGAEALAIFDRRRAEIQLVLLDMSMPVMGGNECFRKLRERSKVPVLLASGFAPDHEAQMLLAADAAGFLEKPFTRGQLSATIDKILTA
ncbi:MAG: response regulator [Proteobacteria bacterium]|nr:response regulator [Pseudomonadota bacterium]